MNAIVIIILTIIIVSALAGLIWKLMLISVFKKGIDSIGANPCLSDQYMFVNNKCTEICRTGYYLNPNDYLCYPCPIGTEHDPRSFLGVNACRQCSTGLYTDQVGTISCKPCPTGMVSINGITCHAY